MVPDRVEAPAFMSLEPVALKPLDPVFDWREPRRCPFTPLEVEGAMWGLSALGTGRPFML